MGNDSVIRGKSITITPLKSHTEEIQKISTPHTMKDCKSFCGLVNHLSLLCNSLQKILKLITYLTRKVVPLIWGNVQEPSACKNYSTTELEMTGLLVNILLWKAYLKRCEFDAYVDYAVVCAC